ncbi:hypothetical protein Golax_015042, partial [Gossypium laxum]|nr:hypothetical protein [Gossypium laxum]
MDRDRVINGSPWIFNNHILLLHVLKDDADPLEVSLLYTTFWVQIQSLSTGVISEAMARQFGDFIGTFLDYDAKAVAVGLRKFMQIQQRVADGMRHLIEGTTATNGDLNEILRKWNNIYQNELSAKLAGQHVLKECQPHICLFIESKLDVRRIERVRWKYDFQNGINVPANGSCGGLSLGWTSDCNVTHRSFNEAYIDVIIMNEENGIEPHSP